MNEVECLKCKAWDMAAKMAGKSSGMCEECFNKHYVLIKDQPESSKREDLVKMERWTTGNPPQFRGYEWRRRPRCGTPNIQETE